MDVQRQKGIKKASRAGEDDVPSGGLKVGNAINYATGRIKKGFSCQEAKPVIPGEGPKGTR